MATTAFGQKPATMLQRVLWLASLHSAAVGLGLILHPAPILARMGYAPVNEPFFPTQGGVFHLVMALGYGMAAANLVRRRCLVEFAIWVKSIATVFLLIYWVFISHVVIVLGSAIGDGLLAVALYLAFKAWRGETESGGL